MGKNRELLGIVCEHSRISITVVSHGEIKKTLWVNTPEDILSGAEIRSEHMLSAMIRDTLKKNKIRCRDAAYALPNEEVFIRTIEMPLMEDEQIRFNIPFEFRDFIHGELDTYVFDYAYLSRQGGRDEATGEETMSLVAAAVSSEYLERIRAILKGAGLRMVKAMPEMFSYERLLAKLPKEDERNKEVCFIDIGSSASRMIVLKNDRYKLTQVIDIGLEKVKQVLADEMNVDMHLADTYLKTNYQDCRNMPQLVNIYKDISLEVLKGLNFYEVSDMTSRLQNVILCGVGATIEPLVNLLKERIAMEVVTIQELFSDWTKDSSFNITAVSYGLTLGDQSKQRTSINFIGVNEKKTQWRLIVPACLFALVVAAAFVRFGILEPYQRLQNAQEEVAAVQSRFDEKSQQISEASQLGERYYHYTWSGMTEEERNRVSRVRVAELVLEIRNSVLSVGSYSLAGSTLSVNITADSLDSISLLVLELQNDEIVESCSVTTAQARERAQTVHANLVIYLK